MFGGRQYGHHSVALRIAKCNRVNCLASCCPASCPSGEVPGRGSAEVPRRQLPLSQHSPAPILQTQPRGLPSNCSREGGDDLIPYRSAIGSLMYLAVCTRPDISVAISNLSRFNANPGRADWEGVQHVLRYLQGTSGGGEARAITNSLRARFVLVNRLCL